MTITVKICGVTREGDAELAARHADLVGINLWPGSTRFVARDRARALVAAIRASRPAVEVVGVFVDADERALRDAIADLGLDRVQLHGAEPAALVAAFAGRALKAVALGRAADLDQLDALGPPLVLIDTPSAGKGGSGAVGDWALAGQAVARLRSRGVGVLLAGGLTPANVGAAIAAVRPAGVDVASGVESSPGVKDHARMVAFVAAARAAAKEQT